MNYARLSEEGRLLYKKVVCEELWLKYFNNTLRRHRIITEREYLRMHEMILVRTGELLKKCDKELT